MDIKQLTYFVTVAEEGTISAAAKKLFLSQPPLTVKIHELENELGCLLFERTPRQMVLTDAGKLLYTRAIPLLQMVEVTREEVMDQGSESGGTVRIGLISSVIQTKICTVLCDYARLHPRVTLDFYESNTYQLLEKLRTHTIHMGIVRTPFNGNGFDHLPLLSDRMVAVERCQDAADTAAPLTLEELAGRRLIVYRRWEHVMKSTFASRNLELKIACRNDDARTTLFLARQGLGTALLPASAVGESRGLVSREIQGNPWQTDVELLYDGSVFLPGNVKQLMTYLMKHCRPGVVRDGAKEAKSGV